MKTLEELGAKRVTHQEYNVHIINSIQHKYKDLRQKSKPATFALTYSGTPHTLVNNLKFTKEEAERMYNAYHELYKQSDAWLDYQIDKARVLGKAILAFGLNLETNFIGKKETLETKHLVEHEKRTIGNALVQSWGMLNDRAVSDMLDRIDAKGLTQSCLPVCCIHDASYWLIKDDYELLEWFNKNIVEAYEWQGHPDLKSPVKITGELSVFYPSWANEIEIPHNATVEELKELLKCKEQNT